MSPIYIMSGYKFLKELAKIRYLANLKLAWKIQYMLLKCNNTDLTVSGNELEGLMIHFDSQFLQRQWLRTTMLSFTMGITTSRTLKISLHVWKSRKKVYQYVAKHILSAYHLLYISFHTMLLQHNCLARHFLEVVSLQLFQLIT